jgi:hypothetical protein
VEVVEFRQYSSTSQQPTILRKTPSEQFLRNPKDHMLPHRYHPPALPARNINDRKISDSARKDFNGKCRMQQQNLPSNPSSQHNQEMNCKIFSTSIEHKQQLKPRSMSYDPSDSSKTVPKEFFSKWSAADLLNGGKSWWVVSMGKHPVQSHS